MKWSDQATELGSGETSPARVDIDVSLVRTLVASQFPQWTYLPIKPVASGGWDNRTFHLGEGMTVRLPNAARYSAQVEKEQRWLPRLAPLLPLLISVPLAMGVPAHGYPMALVSLSVARRSGRDHRTHRRSAPICDHARRVPSRSAPDRSGRWTCGWTA
jgi:aminoglycoside phosphotransferase (APT) family kinase protein